MEKKFEIPFKTITDLIGSTLVLQKIPERIVSLVPSQTELLFDLGLDKNIVGITKFCIHPKERCALKQKIGGTKNFNIEKIKSLNPDLIIANKEENTKEGVDKLRNYFPVYVSDITDLTSSLQMIIDLATITNTVRIGKTMVANIKKEFDILESSRNTKIISAAYLIWNNPLMVAGSGNFIDAMLQLAGYKNVFSKNIGRYPTINHDDLIREIPEVVFLSSEPYPFKEKHKAEIKQLLPNSKIEIVDGEMFSWYGSRLLKTPNYLLQLKNKLKGMVVC